VLIPKRRYNKRFPVMVIDKVIVVSLADLHIFIFQWGGERGNIDTVVVLYSPDLLAIGY